MLSSRKVLVEAIIFFRELEHILWKPNVFFANIGTKILPWKWRILLIIIAVLLLLCWIQLRFIIPSLGFYVGTNHTLINMITMLNFPRSIFCNVPKISYNFYNNFFIYFGYELSQT